MAQAFKPPATQRVYDVCVIGSQLGGVVAGALLARRDFRVLHVAHDDLGPSYVEGGYLLPYGPAFIPSPRQLPAAEAALTELGLLTDVGRVLEPSDPDLQLLLPRHRVDLSRDPARLGGELRREWPRDVEALESAFAELGTLFDFAGFFMKAAPPLPPKGLSERWALRKAAKQATSLPNAPRAAVGTVAPFGELDGHELVRSLAVGHRWLTYLDGPPSPLSLVRLLGGAMRATHRLGGGLGALGDMVRRRIAESRGELQGGPGAPATAMSLELEGNRIAAVRLAGSPDVHVARAFVFAADAESIRRLLPADAAQARAAEVLGLIRPSRRLLTLNLVVKVGALPPALGDNVLALRDAAGGDGIDNAVFLQVLPARRDGGKRGAGEVVEDERLVCASAFVPASLAGREQIAAATARIREAVADAIPFFERHQVTESSPALHAPGGPDEGLRLLCQPLYRADLEATLGVTGLPIRAPWRNAFFAGREVIPGLGVEGEFHAGLQAAGYVSAALGRKEPLR